MERKTSRHLDRTRAAFELVTQRTSIIRALYIVSVAANGPREDILEEFHAAVGDILEGVPLSKLGLVYISKSKVLDEVKWLTDRSS